MAMVSFGVRPGRAGGRRPPPVSPPFPYREEKNNYHNKHNLLKRIGHLYKYAKNVPQ
jgi:hypothetical protein